MSVENLLTQIRQCQICMNKLPYPPKPLIQASKKAEILILGQAPGEKAHLNGKLFDDISGDRLRTWLGINENDFYNQNILNIVPMGFCYPGTIIHNKKRVGDRPPLQECRTTWHPILLPKLNQIKLIILMGKYAINYYLNNNISLTDAVFDQNSHGNNIFAIPHPSPRNNIWLAKHPEFEKYILPKLKLQVSLLIKNKKYR